MMFVIEKGITPDGISIQIEDWSESYPNTYKKNATIGFYPVAVHDIIREDYPHWTPYPKRGARFRADLEFDSEAEAKAAFESLKSGEKTYMDYLDNYGNQVLSRAKFIEAVTL